MSNKCFYTFILYCGFTALAVIAMHLFLLLPVNQWAGLITGFVLFCTMGVLAIGFSKKRIISYFVCAGNALASGIALSSFYVWLEDTPLPWQSAAIWGISAVYFAAFCFLTNLRFVQDFSSLCTLIYLLPPLAGGIVGVCLSSVTVFSLALFFLVPLTAYLIALSTNAKNLRAHMKNAAYASFGALLALLILVFFCIGDSSGSSEGSGSGDFGGFFSRNRRNPYEFYKR